ncbi:MAG: hypothetical protein ACYS0E_14915 [Planctomycetota bacterium]
MKRAKRKLDRRADDDPLRRVRLRARGRKFLRDSDSSQRVDSILIGAMTIMAMAAGYRMAHVWQFDAAGTLLAPFVLIGLCAMVWGKMPLGARLLGLVLGLGFLLWPLYT